MGKRVDQHHEICTTFQTISLCDYLTFEKAADISLTCDAPNIPVDETNLIVRAAQTLRRRFSGASGVKIHLEKSIPSPGGLGGGSADAAVALLALTHLWKIKTTRGELQQIAQSLGADVPFFLVGGTAFATGTGTAIESLPDLPKKHLLIVTPNENVSTAEAYRSLAAPPLTEVNSLSILTICCSARINGESSVKDWQNDFENKIFAFKPEIERARNSLLDRGATVALMSGSGASVFGIFDNETTRQNTFDVLRETEKDWRVFAAETVSRSEYEKALFSFSSLPSN